MTVETRACVFELDPRGFVRATMRHGLEMTLSDAKEALEATATIAQGAKRPVLVDMRGIRSQARDARDYFASDDPVRVCSAVGILVGSAVSRVIGNFFLRRTAQRLPTRLFDKEASAIAWLVGDVS